MKKKSMPMKKMAMGYGMHESKRDMPRKASRKMARKSSR
jgi:hypothetical protein